MESPTHFSGAVPAVYDHYLGPVLFEPYALDILARLRHDRVSQALELACGTGRVTRHLAAQLPPGGRLVATDIDGDMLQLARQLIPDPRVEWLQADAQQLPFPDAAFDHVVCQFGMMFVVEKERAYAEAFRVLEPGGKLIFNVWDALDANPCSALLQETLRALLGSSAPDLGQKGPFSYFDREAITGSVLSAGFEHVNLEVVKKAGWFPEVADLVTGFVDGSPLSGFVQKQGPEFGPFLKTSLAKALTDQFGSAGLAVSMQALVVEALRSPTGRAKIPQEQTGHYFGMVSKEPNPLIMPQEFENDLQPFGDKQLDNRSGKYTEANDRLTQMTELQYCLKRLEEKGFTDQYRVEHDRLVSTHDKKKKYKAKDIHAVNFFRFEGITNPDDMSILYAIETSDGQKGTLIDAYGLYSDEATGAFMKEVEIHKKVTEGKLD
jgi:SAM-dependent methyltransferase